MSNNFNMEWGNIPEPGTGGNVDFLRLQNGANQLRIVGKPSLIEIHWEKAIDGSSKKVICTGASCPICKAGHAPQARYQVKVIDRTDGKIKVLEGGPTIFNAIKAYAMDPDYGDPTKYDVKIKKDGQGRETRYTVVPAPKPIPLKPDEIKAIEESKSLEEINKSKTVEEIMQLGLEILVGSTGDLSGDNGSAGGSDDNISDDDWNSL